MILSDILDLEHKIQGERESINELERSAKGIQRMLEHKRRFLGELEKTHSEAIADLREHTPPRGTPLQLEGASTPEA
jgi:predicted  nucleic acid-binding Zn-ribbon protein